MPSGGAFRAWVARLLRAEGGVMLALVAGGVLVAAAWRALAPHVAGAGNALESDAAVDGTLAALSVVAGVVTAAAVLIRPGASPIRRTLVAIVFSVVAGVISWQVGDRMGTPPLRATGACLVWAIITSAGLFAGALLPVLSRRLETEIADAPSIPPQPVAPIGRHGPT